MGGKRREEEGRGGKRREEDGGGGRGREGVCLLCHKRAADVEAKSIADSLFKISIYFEDSLLFFFSERRGDKVCRLQ